jgi:sec-independent protein translocase protein TatA
MSVVAFLEGPELVIVLVVILLVFGGSQLPKLARSLGQAQREFQKGIREGTEDQRPDVAVPRDDGSDASDKVVMSQAELDALLQAKEDEIRRQLSDGNDDASSP